MTKKPQARRHPFGYVGVLLDVSVKQEIQRRADLAERSLSAYLRRLIRDAVQRAASEADETPHV